ncbi:MAG: D-glycero-beta-D-manno-heptose 1,7-bisphosphate 7-phosphatase [Desulfobacter sp.]|nr:D-glycero-beta-D-manno-heptose 1,7-bisphosphate 7-phosphatase [Desulfobacter sp.]WDP84072.1 MAG: D-glycero-beta-D-manno-heptose 1,7-bisphosphate 7-phosphatase [Desulfobacter sp.]
MTHTIFLDRDGVINVDSPDYIKTPDEFHFIPRSPEAVALLTAHGFEVVIITNQSAVGRKMITQKTLEAIFDRMTAGVEAAGGRIKDIFFCPHAPDENCPCRKPLPGLIIQAVDRHRMDLEKAVMVGDSAKDIECGIAAGCANNILVATGNGHKALALLSDRNIIPDFFAQDLYAAATWIISTLAPLP